MLTGMSRNLFRTTASHTHQTNAEQRRRAQYYHPNWNQDPSSPAGGHGNEYFGRFCLVLIDWSHRSQTSLLFKPFSIMLSSETRFRVGLMIPDFKHSSEMRRTSDTICRLLPNFSNIRQHLDRPQSSSGRRSVSKICQDNRLILRSAFIYPPLGALAPERFNQQFFTVSQVIWGLFDIRTCFHTLPFCSSPECPIRDRHRIGPYRHNGRGGTISFNGSNPPPEVWAAYFRRLLAIETLDDLKIEAGFRKYHT